jgi:hypothetical protein
MVSTWTDTVLSQQGKKPQRGFGGRLIFYAEDEEKPVVVDGQLVVYAFDETGREPSDNKPTRRYVFPPDQIPLHMSKSDLGATYSFWLPWDEAGGAQTEVSLICRFEPKGGSVITSEQTRQRLPGSIAPATIGHRDPPKLPEGVPSRPAQLTLEKLQAQRAAEQAVQLASFESPIAPNARVTSIDAGVASPIEPERRMTTTSISLPQNYKVPSATPQSFQPVVPAAGYTPNLMQPPVNATPIPTSAAPMRAVQQNLIQSAMPAGGLTQAGALQTGTTTTLASQWPATTTAAPPQMYSPMSQGFGHVPPMQQQIHAPQVGGALARASAARSLMWNNVQAAQAGTMAQQPIMPTAGQSQTIVQPASQPLPAATPLTTTVTYPQAAAQY